MFSMNVDYYDFIFLQLKTYLQANSKYSPTVLKKPMNANPQYPQVVLTEVTNSDDGGSINRRERRSVLGYNVEIFSTVKVVNGVTVDNLVICRELAKLTDDVFDFYRFNRMVASPAPNVDTTLYRIVHTYNARMFNNYNQII